MMPGVTHLPRAVDDGGVGRRLEVAADRGDAAVGHQHVGVVEALAGAGEHGGVADDHRRREARRW